MWSQLKSHTPVLERERHREHSLHRIKLLRIKKRGQSPVAKGQVHLSPINPRKHRLVQEKFDEIRWENQLLFKRMIEIGSKPTTVSMFASNQLPAVTSLNRRNRLHSQSKISQENDHLLKRLQRTQSSYSVKQWEEESGYHSYLRQRVSQNAGRVPRSSNYTSASFDRLLSVTSLKGANDHSRKTSPKRSRSAGTKLLAFKFRNPA